MDDERIDLDQLERACRIAEIAKTGIVLRAHECRYLLDTIKELRARLEAQGQTPGRSQPHDDEPVAGTA